MTNLFRLKSVQCDSEKVIRRFGLEEKGRVQKFIDNECLKLCAEKVPKDTEALIKSGVLNTQIGSGEIKYRTPYARRWYYMPASFNEAPERGNYWFERMKQQHKEKILAGAKRITGGSQ